MFIVPEDDILLFAKGLKGRVGPRAKKIAQERAKQLSAAGDREGENAWGRVVEALRSLDRSPQ
jgi:hypothetical protein